MNNNLFVFLGGKDEVLEFGTAFFFEKNIIVVPDSEYKSFLNSWVIDKYFNSKGIPLESCDNPDTMSG